jgi:ankyrin repeat protein
MPTIPLPQDPDLEQLRKQARELQRAVRAGDQTALALVAEFHPNLTPYASGFDAPSQADQAGRADEGGRAGGGSRAAEASGSDQADRVDQAGRAAEGGGSDQASRIDQAGRADESGRAGQASQAGRRGFPLSAAQLVIARRYDFPSWPRLRRHVEIVTARSWTPGAPPPGQEPLADRFLRLACLTYSNDERSDRIAAARLLAHHPELPTLSLPVAAACADVAQVSRFLAAHPSLATATAGPHGWSPLLYQAYARHDPQVGLDATIQTARLLLQAGADPNDGRFWHGLPTPFTVLTGVLGHGEGGVDRQPAHPHSIPFGRLLLEAGADPNDGQALYNRMFSPSNDHLVLLFEFGLGRETNGPWHQRMLDALETPQQMLRNLLRWAISHDQRDRVALLAANGVDVVSPFTDIARGYDERTPVELALFNGNRELASQLLELGAAKPRLSPADEFIGAALAGDAQAVAAADPGLVARLRQDWPGLVTWAASQGAPNAVDLLVGAGFDVNGDGRSDILDNDPWHTALHVAAGEGKLELARRLLELGADPRARDKHYNSTPLGWARYFDHQPLIDLLGPVTRENEPHEDNA